MLSTKDSIVSTIASLSIFFNIVLLLYLLRIFKAWKNVHVLTFSLATSDLIFSSALLVLEILFLDAQVIRDCGARVIVVLVGFTSLLSSFNLQVLAVERFVAVQLPIFARIHFSKRRTVCLVFCLWIIVSAVCIAAFVTAHKADDVKAVAQKFLLGFAITELALGSTIVLSYALIVYNLFKRWRCDSRALCLRQVEAVAYCISLSIAFVIGFFPYSIKLLMKPNEVPNVESFLLILNALINPTLYLIKYQADKFVARRFARQGMSTELGPNASSLSSSSATNKQ